MAVKIMIDSASDISASEAEKLGVIMVPMTISFGKEEYFDGVDLLPEKFYEKLIESDELPKTGQVTAFRFEEAIKNNLGDGDEIVIITISSKLSGTYSGAVSAAQNFGGRVRVVDSLNACTGERILCLHALKLRDSGRSAKDIAAELERLRKKVVVMALLGTLEYLKKGGRISAAVAFAGEMLSLKPVVAVEDGEVKLVGKALGSKKGNNLLTKLIAEKGGIDFSMPYGVMWSGLENAMLKKYVADSEHIWNGQTSNLPAYMLGGTIGTHVGPGAIGVAFFCK
ncbi:MAG: DegV family protein [Candidatus Coproplasma sp.]